MKKKLWVTLLASVLIMTGCQVKTENNRTKTEEKATTEKVKSKEKSNDEKSKDKSAKEEKKSDDSPAVSIEGTQRVGSDTQGYLSIPEDWITFTDAAGGDQIQYTDPKKPTFAIVTIDVFDAKRLGVDDMSKVTAEDVANSLAGVWDGQDTVSEMHGAMTTVSGHEAYQVNTTLKTGQMITTWSFKTKDDGNVYYIALEGDKETFQKMLPYIEGTWSETK